MTSHAKMKKRLKFVCAIICCYIVLVSATYTAQWKENIYSRIRICRQMEKEVSSDTAKKIVEEAEYFPVCEDKSGKESYSFEDVYGHGRQYGGNRKHEGIDIMTSNNQAGYFAIRSVTDGVIEKKGWLELGGYRLGIRSASGVYYYYAHLNSYAKGMKCGTYIKAGDIIGYMGNTGYGKEGTKGKFDVHLHFGMYVNKKGKEKSINPYFLLRYLQKQSA